MVRRWLLFLLLPLALLPAGEPVRVLHVPDYPPYEYLDEEGQPQGAFIELYRLWGKATGREVRFICMPFSEELVALADGRGDVITAMTWTPERSKTYDFAPAILTERNNIVVMAGDAAATPADLRGRQVGIVAGEAVGVELLRLGAEPVAVPDYSALVDALLAGRIQAATTSTEVLLHHLTRRDALGRVRVLEPPLLVTGFRPAVRAGNSALLAELEAGFARIPMERRRDVIERWLPSERGQARIEEQGRRVWWIAGALAAAAASAIGLWLGNRALRRRVGQATSDLAEANRLLRGVLDAATEVSIIATDPHGIITVFNTGAERLTGRRAVDLVGRETPLILHDPEEVRTRGGRLAFAVFIEAAARAGSSQSEWTYVRPDGGRRTVALTVTPMRDHDGTVRGWLELAVDVSERRRMEERMRQVQRMDALGQLAGGVAHDFNNMLTGIMGYAEVLALTLAGEQREQAEAIVRGCEGAAGLCRQMLAFSRKSGAVRRPVDLNVLVRQTVDLFRHGAGTRIAVVLDLAATPATVVGDDHLLANALLNLLVNARDAMADGGTITVATRRETGAGPDQIVLTVSDTGPGIPADVLPRIFEPFFTTKPAGKGTGLGLSAVYGIIEEHGGQVAVDSPPGCGASFSLRLPAAATASIAAAASPLPQGGGGRVLLIDDDAGVRTALAAGLAALGWEVRTSDGAAAGRDIALAWHPDILVVDQIMPQQHGSELLADLRRAGLACPAILLSGHQPEDGLDRAGLRLAAVLSKPVRLGDLATVLARSLAPTAGS